MVIEIIRSPSPKNRRFPYSRITRNNKSYHGVYHPVPDYQEKIEKMLWVHLQAKLPDLIQEKI